MFSLRVVGLLLLVSCLLSGCLSSRNSGGYYKDDGPPRGRVDVSKVADAQPRVEPRSRTGNKPYTALGKRYYPLQSASGFKESGQASWYGKKFHGNRTSSGERYNMYAMTAAHRTLPLPTYVRVVNVDNNRSVIVKVNDRGPFLHNRIIDVSYAAAVKLDMLGRGTANVMIEAIDPTTFRPANARIPSSATRPSVPVTQANVGAVKLPEPRYRPAASNAAAGAAGIQRQALPSRQLNQPSLAGSKPVRSTPPSSLPNAGSLRATAAAGVASKPDAATVRWQVGAFGLATNAANLQTRLINDGFAAVAVMKTAGLYKVVLGPYRPADAASAQLRLQQLGYTVKLFKDS